MSDSVCTAAGECRRHGCQCHADFLKTQLAKLERALVVADRLASSVEEITCPSDTKDRILGRARKDMVAYRRARRGTRTPK